MTIPRSESQTSTSRTRHARELFAGIAPEYDLMAELLSFGQNGRWRRFLASRAADGNPRSVLDVATGTGRVAVDVARRSTGRVVGVDQSEAMLRRGLRSLDEGRLAHRISFVLGRAEQLPFPDACFDALTFTYLLRYVDDPAATLAELLRVVVPGGFIGNLEFLVPPNAAWRAAWHLYTRVGLPMVGRIASREWHETGRFLGPSITDFYRRYPLREQLRMWRAAGAERVHHRVMSLGGGIVIWGYKTHA